MRTLVNLSVVLSLALVPALTACSERDNSGVVSPVDKNNVFDLPDGGSSDQSSSNNNIPNPDDNTNIPGMNDDAGQQNTGPACDQLSEGVSIWGVSKVCGYSTSTCLVNCSTDFANNRDQVQYNNCYDNCLANDSGFPAHTDSGEIDCGTCLVAQQYKCLADYGCETQVDNLVCCASANSGAACTSESNALNTCISGLGANANNCFYYDSAAFALCFPN